MAGAVSTVSIRLATVEDCGLILHFIRELAVFEKAPDAVVATEDDLRRHGFGANPRFETLIAELDGEPAGMALFHTRFSTWLGQPTLFLEDLFVAASARKHGVGRKLMTGLARIALERGWGRIDFHVLDWNPARGFYARLGFEHATEWLRYGMDATGLARLVAEDAD
jgi:GNAT superfamily N-acetyltransferase